MRPIVKKCVMFGTPSVFKENGVTYGPWFVAAGTNYVHSDGTIQLSCRHSETGLFTGWYRTRREAREAARLARQHTYTVEKYVTIVETYTVKAKSKAEAIQKVWDADGELVKTEHLEDNTDTGMSTEHLNDEDVKALDLGHGLYYVPAIRSVEIQ